MTRKKSVIGFIEYLFALSVIISGGTMYGVIDGFYTRNINDFTLRIICMAVTCSLIAINSIRKKIRITHNQAIGLLISILVFAIYLAATRYGVNSCIESVCIPFILFYILSSIYGPDDLFIRFFNKYSSIMYCLAIISLFFYFGGTVLGIVPGMGMEYFNNGWWYPGTNYYYLSFINNWQSTIVMGIDIYKNIGIYMEAPGFAFPLVMSLWWELFCNQSINKKRVAVFIITLITTFSVKAIIFGMLVVFMYIYFNTPNKKVFLKKYRWVLFIPVVLVGTIISVRVLSDKIASSATEFGSWAIRLSDLWASLSAWFAHPIFGLGFYNLPEIYKYYPLGRHSGTPTMGLFNILAFGGLFMFFWYFIGFYKYYRKSLTSVNKWVLRSFLIIVFAFLCTSGMQYSYTLLLILAIGWSINRKSFNNNLMMGK